VTPLYPQKLALTSPTGGGRSVGIVRSRTKAKELLLPVSLYCGHSAPTVPEKRHPNLCFLWGLQTRF